MCTGKAKGLACVFSKWSDPNACAARGTNVVAIVLGIIFLLHICRETAHISRDSLHIRRDFLPLIPTADAEDSSLA